MTTHTSKTNRLLIFAGAGISAESGLSTFRDTGGLWTQFDVNEVCNYRTFLAAKDDATKRAHIFDFYNQVKHAVLKAKPNNAHTQIAAWQQTYGPERVKIFTANIDDLFERSGCTAVTHVHGDIHHMHCTSCQFVWPQHPGKDFDSTERCPQCRSRLTKPRVVFFGESAPLYQDLAHAFHLKRRQSDDVILYVGSSMSVIPPSGLIQKALPQNHNVVVNLEPQTEDHWFSHRYYGPATQELKKVDTDVIQKMMT